MFINNIHRIENITVEEIREMSANVFAQMDKLSRVSDKIYVHIDLDILDASEVPFHNYPTENGPTSFELATLFKEIFSRYPKAAAIGFASIPEKDPGQIALQAVNRMVIGAIEGIKIRAGK
ncbi:MAG: arginase family protein [Planctomycetes bacterium]|nr:arginase family protein [Planctomycetota bacterium]